MFRFRFSVRVRDLAFSWLVLGGFGSFGYRGPGFFV